MTPANPLATKPLDELLDACEADCWPHHTAELRRRFAALDELRAMIQERDPLGNAAKALDIQDNFILLMLDKFNPNPELEVLREWCKGDTLQTDVRTVAAALPALIAVVDAAEKYINADDNWTHVKQTDELVASYDAFRAAVDAVKGQA